MYLFMNKLIELPFTSMKLFHKRFLFAYLYLDVEIINPLFFAIEYLICLRIMLIV